MIGQNNNSNNQSSLYPCGRKLLDFPEPLKIIILGASGSIGQQTLDLVRHFPERLQVVAMTCHSNLDTLVGQLEILLTSQPDLALPLIAVTDEQAYKHALELPLLAERLLSTGSVGLLEAVTEPADAHILVNGLVGAVGLAPTLAGAARGLRIALANKESLVVGGDLVKQAVLAGGSELLPVDSEHSAIAQCLSGRSESEIGRLILTASGGPFRTMPAAELAGVSVAQVLKHPTWSMGPKITVDSATLINKGLEVIEAHHLFGVPYDLIDVLVHPGSYVHSLVEFVDGALLAQLGTPDMRIPLMYAISGETHWPVPSGRLNLLEVGSLQFEAPDLDRFPCLKLARAAGVAGGAAPIILNASNEIAVAALLAGRIRYVDIPRIIEDSLTTVEHSPINSVSDALTVDTISRDRADVLVNSLVNSND